MRAALSLRFDELGWQCLYDLVHYFEEAVRGSLPRIGGVLAWLVNTAAFAVPGRLAKKAQAADARLEHGAMDLPNSDGQSGTED